MQSSAWLIKGYLNPVTEALIRAAQDQVLTGWSIIFGELSSDHCRRCGQFAESVEHIVAGVGTDHLCESAQCCSFCHSLEFM